MPQYRIEISKNSRAVCKDSVCKANQDKIQKGEVRFGTWVEIQDHGSWAWKHWGCVSGSQLLNLRETCEQGDGEYDFDLIDGYDELADHSDVQEKIRRCVKQSHIDPEDFKGDPEKNKPGEKGIHLTAKQKAAKEAAAADDSEDAKPAKKSAKRGRKKDVDDEPAEPKSKKSKTASKPDKAEAPKKAVRGSKAKAKVESESDDDAPITTKKKQTPSKAVASKSSGKASATAKTAGKTGRRAKAAVVSDDDEEDEKPVQAKANTKARRTSRGKA